jgi:superfamily I DNA and RNA helicase
MPYFHSLFFGNFAEAQEVDGNMTWISIEPFYEDGIDGELFKKLITFAYCGSLSNGIECEERSDLRMLEESTSILIASNRFGFTKLAQVCENKIIDIMKKSSDYVDEIKDFANSYNLLTLEKKCDDLLRLGEPPAQNFKKSEMKSNSKAFSCVSENTPNRSL